MISTYALNTKVSVEKTRAELDSVLAKYGATARGIVVDDLAPAAQVAFQLHGLRYRIDVPLPPRTSGEPDNAPRGWSCWDDEERGWWHTKQHEQALRTRWRVLLLLIKAKLESVSMGLSTAEKEFIGDLMLDNGHTVYTALGQQIERSIACGTPLMLGMG
jgi:hypothetical protein